MGSFSSVGSGGSIERGRGVSTPVSGPRRFDKAPDRISLTSSAVRLDQRTAAATVSQTPRDQRQREQLEVALPPSPKASQAEDQPPHEPLHTGMRIPVTPERMALGRIVTEAASAWDAEGDEGGRRVAKRLEEVEGIRIQEDGYHHGKGSEQCHQYVFGRRHGDTWVAESEDPRELKHFLSADDQIEVLADHGYQVVDTPAQGDVVGYGSQDRAGWSFRHFGIVAAERRIVSKFGSGPVVEHDVDRVPPFYGSDIVFFHKQPQLPH